MTPVNPFISASISLGEELAEAAEQLRRCTVVVRGAGAGSGSGVIWRPDGLIVTNAHVATSSQHTVELLDGQIFQAELTRRDPRRDLAVLQIAASALPSARSRKASSLRTGELLLAVGNPMETKGAFAVGITSARPQPDDLLMRADIRLAPGNSGGPLADAHGRVVGINSMVVDGFGVAVTSTAVERFIAEDKRRSIGVTVHQVELSRAGLPALGLKIVELEANGAAHLSGLRIGDVIVGVNGESLNRPQQLSDAVQAAGQVLSLIVLRAGQLKVCEVALGKARTAEVA